MEVELTRQTFRRIVMLYLLLLPVVLGVAAFEILNPRWSDFDTAFNSIVVQHFGTRPMEDFWLVVGTVLLVAHLAGNLGLLSFRRWARVAFLWSGLLMSFALALAEPATYSSDLSGLLEGLNMALFGAIVLLSFSKDHGSLWFAPNPAI